MCLAAKRIAPGSMLLVCLRQRREGGTRLDGDAEIDGDEMGDIRI